MTERMNFKEIKDCVVGQTQGCWHCDARLGSGSFGIIHIWSNIKDDLVEKIITKQLKIAAGDSARQKQVGNWYINGISRGGGGC